MALRLLGISSSANSASTRANSIISRSSSSIAAGSFQTLAARGPCHPSCAPDMATMLKVKLTLGRVPNSIRIRIRVRT
jgi:hypothetical protein